VSALPTAARVGIDQDEQQEHAGRFCDYLGGTRVAIRAVADTEAFGFARTGDSKFTCLGGFSEIGGAPTSADYARRLRQTS
jgi:hypothetical protein